MKTLPFQREFFGGGCEMVEIAPSLTNVKLLIPDWKQAMHDSHTGSTFYLTVDKTVNGAIT